MAVATEAGIYIYKNMKKYFKFNLPAIDLNN